jgi:hypothetical protein
MPGEEEHRSPTPVISVTATRPLEKTEESPPPSVRSTLPSRSPSPTVEQFEQLKEKLNSVNNGNSSWEDLEQWLKNMGDTITHNPTYKPVYSDLGDGIFLSKLLVDSSFMGYGDHGKQLIEDCANSDKVLVAVFAVLKESHAQGGILPWNVVDGETWKKYAQDYKDEFRKSGKDPKEFYDIQAHQLNIKDNELNADLNDVHTIIKFMQKCLDPENTIHKGFDFKGKKPTIDIHCNIGVGRSLTLAALLLCTKREMNLFDVIDHIKAIRPQINPSDKQLEFMMSYVERYLDQKNVRSDTRLQKYVSSYKKSIAKLLWEVGLVSWNIPRFALSTLWQGVCGAASYLPGFGAYSTESPPRTPSPTLRNFVSPPASPSSPTDAQVEEAQRSFESLSM